MIPEGVRQYIIDALNAQYPLPPGWSYSVWGQYAGQTSLGDKYIVGANAVKDGMQPVTFGTGQAFGVDPDAWIAAANALLSPVDDNGQPKYLFGINPIYDKIARVELYAAGGGEAAARITEYQGPQGQPIEDIRTAEEAVQDITGHTITESPIIEEDEDPAPTPEDTGELPDETAISARLTDLNKPSEPYTEPNISVGSYYVTFQIPSATQRAASVIAFNLVRGKEVPLPGFGKKIKVVAGAYEGDRAKFEIEVLENPIPVAVFIGGIGLLLVVAGLIAIERIVEASPEIIKDLGGLVGNITMLAVVIGVVWLVKNMLLGK